MPWSKLDLVIFNHYNEENSDLNIKVLEDFRNFLCSEKDYNNSCLPIKEIEIKHQGSFKILKVVISRRNCPLIIEITTRDPSSEKNIELIKDYLSEYVLLKPIVLVLKQILYLSQLTISFSVSLEGRHLVVLLVSHDCRVFAI